MADVKEGLRQKAIHVAARGSIEIGVLIGLLLLIKPEIKDYMKLNLVVQAQAKEITKLEAEINVMRSEWLSQVKEINHSVSGIHTDIQVIKFRLGSLEKNQ